MILLSFPNNFIGFLFHYMLISDLDLNVQVKHLKVEMIHKLF